MTKEELIKLKEKIEKESIRKRQLRRENSACFINSNYWKYGTTAKDMFKRKLLAAIRKEEKNERTLN